MRARTCAVLALLIGLNGFGACLVGDHPEPHDLYERAVGAWLSGPGHSLYLGLGLAPVVFARTPREVECGRTTLRALLWTGTVVECLKRLTRERRPGGGAPTSFPSGHTAAAFAVATVAASYHPRQALGWYLVAGGIGWSRMRLNRHYPHDVVAGALIGHWIARQVLAHRDRWSLLPDGDTGWCLTFSGGSEPWTLWLLLDRQRWGIRLCWQF